MKPIPFKTYEGARKRCAFENAHPRRPGDKYTVRKVASGYEVARIVRVASTALLPPVQWGR